MLLMTNLSITAKQDKTQWTTVTKQLFGQGQSDHVHSLLMLACYPGVAATAPTVNFFIVKYSCYSVTIKFWNILQRFYLLNSL